VLAANAFTDGIGDALQNVGEFIPKLIVAIIILLLGWLLARLLRSVTERILRAIRFDDWVDRAGIGAHVERAGYPDSGRLLALLVYYAVLLLALKLAIDVFGESDVQDALDAMIAFLPRLFVALLIIVIAGAIANVVKGLVAAATTQLAYGNVLANLASAGIWVIGIFAALDQLKIAEDVVDLLLTAVLSGIVLIIAIMFGVGGIWAARDRFWPRVFDFFEPSRRGTTAAAAPTEAAAPTGSESSPPTTP
jgi:hypothetical protein